MKSISKFLATTAIFSATLLSVNPAQAAGAAAGTGAATGASVGVGSGVGTTSSTSAGINSTTAGGPNTLNTNTTPNATGSTTGLDLSNNPNQPKRNHTGRDDNPAANTTAANGVAVSTTTSGAIPGATASTNNSLTTSSGNYQRDIKVRRGTTTNSVTPTSSSGVNNSVNTTGFSNPRTTTTNPANTISQ